MTDGLTREDKHDLMDAMNRGFDGINDRLDELNGRTRKNENAIAVHEASWQRLDKATQMPSRVTSDDGVKPDWKMLAGIGAVLGGMAYGAWQAVVKVSGALVGK